MAPEVFNFLGSRLALTLLEQPGAARSSQEEAGAARRSQEQPGVARSNQKQSGTAKGSQLSDLSPFVPNTVWGLALE